MARLFLLLVVLGVVISNGCCFGFKVQAKRVVVCMSSNSFGRAIAISTIAFTISSPFDVYAAAVKPAAVPSSQVEAPTTMPPPIKFVEEIVVENFIVQKKGLLEKKSVLTSSISAISKEVSKTSSDFEKELTKLNDVNSKLKNRRIDASIKSSLNSLKNGYNKEVNAALAVKKNKMAQLERAKNELEAINKQIKEIDENIKKATVELRSKKEQRMNSERKEAAKKAQKSREQKKFNKSVLMRKATVVVEKEQDALDRILRDEADIAIKAKELAAKEKKEKAVVGKLVQRINAVEVEYQSLKVSLDREQKTLNDILAREGGLKASSAADKEAIEGARGSLGIAKKNLQSVQSTRI